MFKKAFKVASTNSLSGKDKKKLIADLSKFYDPEAINILFEKSNPNLVANKLQGSKIQIYIAGDVPLFVDATSKGDFFPTIYTFQQVQTLSQSVEVNPGVDAFLAGGANLMWTGVKNPNGLGDFKKDDVRYIKTAENKIIAVGAMACSSQELAEKGAQGTAMFILHVIDDKLWTAGPKTVLPALIAEAKKDAPAQKAADKSSGKEEVKAEETAGKKSKQEKEKEPEKKKEESESSEEEEEEEEEDHGADDLAQYFGGMIKKKPAAGGQSKPAQPKPKAAAPKKTVAKKADDDFDDDEDDRKKKGKKGAKGAKKDDFEETKKDNKKGKKGGKKQKESEEEDEEDEDEEEEQEEKKTNEPKQGGGQHIPTKIVDEYVMEAFLTALKISVDDSDLPLAAADLYSKHMVPCKREGISIDLKNSSYQKMGKFLQSMAKLGIIEFKESKKGAAPQITKVNRTHSKLADFEPVVSKSSKKDNKEDEQGDDDDRWPKVDIIEVFKVKEQILKFFPEDTDKEDKDKLYTREEVQNAIQKYINKHNLVEKKFIKLDEEMKPYFWVEKAESEGEEEGEEDEEGNKKAKAKKPAQFTMSKEDLFKKLEDYMAPHYKIVDLKTKQEEVKAGAFKGITMVAEKSHNKSVTKIIGLEPFHFNISSLVSKFQSKFECSVTTHTFKEKNAEKTEITVHGGFIDEITDYFTDECKIDSKYINSTNKLDKKKVKTFNM